MPQPSSAIYDYLVRELAPTDHKPTATAVGADSP